MPLTNPLTPTLFLWSSGPIHWGIEASQICEVLPYSPLHILPGFPRYVLGFFQHRSQWIPVLDLADQGNAVTYEPSDVFVVCEAPAGSWACLATALHGFVEAAFQEPLSLPKGQSTLFHQVATRSILWEHRTIFLLDIPLLNTSVLAPIRRTVPPLPSDQQVEHPETLQTIPSAKSPCIGSPQVSLALFQFGGMTFGVEMANLQECLEIQDMSPIPCCPPWIIGQTNIHGDIFTILDIRSFLQAPPGPWRAPITCIIPRLPQQDIAIAVDSILGSITLPCSAILRHPTWHLPQGESFITGLVMHSSLPFSVIDLESLLSSERVTVYDPV